MFAAGIIRARLTRALACFASAALFAPAYAQNTADEDVSPNSTVAERFQRNYEAAGIRAGGFTVFPSVTLAQIYDDNIYGEPTGAEEDLIGDLGAALRIASNWSRHGLELSASARRLQYYENEEESTTDYGGGARAFLSIGARSRADVSVGWRKATEPRRSTQTAVGGVDPVRYTTATAAVDFDFRQTRFREQFGAAILDDDFDDVAAIGGGVIDQDFRDRNAYTAYYRQSFRVRPTIAVFGEVRGEIQEYDTPQIGLGAVQDSTSWSALGGLALDINKVARGEIGVGYQSRDFDDPVFADIEGFSADAELAYFVSDLTTIIIAADRSIRDTAVPGVAGYLSTGAGVTVQHELFRPVLLVGSFQWRRDDFRGIDRLDRAMQFSAGLDYAFRRSIALSLRYLRFDVDSEGLAARAGLTENVVRLGLELRR